MSLGIIIPLIIFTLFAMWTDRNLDYALTYIKDYPVDCPFWLSFIVSILAPAALILNIICELARLVA